MKNKQKFLAAVSTVMIFATAALIQSCTKSADPINSEITQTVNNESTQDAQQDEADDIASGQLNTVDKAGSRVAGSSVDSRVSCAKITRDTTHDKTQGGITIDFDKHPDGSANPQGCTDSSGNIRKGIISISWINGRWFRIGSTVTITFVKYSINGVVINGTRTLTNITSNVLQPTWTVASSVSSTWPDSTKATRTVAKTREWDILAGKVTVSQTSGSTPAATGTNRHGKTYSVQITVPLVYKLLCRFSTKVYLPVSGTKVITIDGTKTITIDYGNGACNRTFTITFDGKTDTIGAKNDASAD